jgi:hypothetical protein
MSARRNLERRAKAKIGKLVATLTPEQIEALVKDLEASSGEAPSPL